MIDHAIAELSGLDVQRRPQIGGMIDPVNGGMKGAPKFPQPAMLEFLWRAGQRTNDTRYFAAVQLCDLSANR